MAKQSDADKSESTTDEMNETNNQNLLSVSPNPFNPTTTLTISLQEDSQVEMLIFDMSGRIVSRLLNGIEQRGTRTLQWNSKSDNGSQLASGTYIVQLSGISLESRKAFSETRKLLLMK